MNKSSLVRVSPLIVAVLWADLLRADEKPSGSARWEAEIAAIEARDREQPPPKGGVLFVGSSSIRRWDLPKSFPDRAVINHGFGGSELADSVYFADRIVLSRQPRVVVVYAGDNDIARGKSPEEVAADYRTLVDKIHTALSTTKIVYIGLKPSLARWKLIDKMRAANALIQAETEKDKRLVYVDVETQMLDKNGQPRRELFVGDGLHLSDEGYRLWTSLVLPHLAE